MGIMINSSGTVTLMRASGIRFLSLATASPTTSSTGSSVFFTLAVSLLILVTDRRFSTMFRSQLESSRMWRTSSLFSSSDISEPFSR